MPKGLARVLVVLKRDIELLAGAAGGNKGRKNRKLSGKRGKHLSQKLRRFIERKKVSRVYAHDKVRVVGFRTTTSTTPLGVQPFQQTLIVNFVNASCRSSSFLEGTRRILSKPKTSASSYWPFIFSGPLLWDRRRRKRLDQA